MSMEQAKLFIERMAKDEAFRTKIMAVDDVAERIRLVNAEGYDCASEEIKTMLDELNDAAVEGASGGNHLPDLDHGSISFPIGGNFGPGGNHCGVLLYSRIK